MKKTVSAILALILMVSMIPLPAYAALQYIKHMASLGEPSRHYDHQTFLAGIDTFKTEHPSLMTDEAAASLKALGEEAEALETLCDVEHDPFDDTYNVWFRDIHEANEDHQVVFEIKNGEMYYTVANIMDDEYLSINRFILLASNGLSIEEDCSDVFSDFDLTNSGMYIESMTNICGYGWDDIFDGDEITSATVRFYDKDDLHADYVLTEKEVTAMKTLFSLDEIVDSIGGLLYDWCESVDGITESSVPTSTDIQIEKVAVLNPEIAAVLVNGALSYPLTFAPSLQDTLYLEIPEALFSDSVPDTMKNTHYLLTGKYTERNKLGMCLVETEQGIVSVNPPLLVSAIVDDSYPAIGETANFYVTYTFTDKGIPFFDLGFQ